MELKKAESEENLEEAAQEALRQVRERGYTVKYEKMGYEAIPIGMAFFMEREWLLSRSMKIAGERI